MDILDAGDTLETQVATLRKAWGQYDFFFLHYKYTDSTGEDGNFAKKVEVIEKLDALVLGIDMRRYLINLAADPRPCADPAGDLEALARAAEKQAGYATYVTPAVVGYSSGATLAYAALAEAWPNAFRGGIGLGFCAAFPDKHPFCPGNGLASAQDPHGKGVDFLPSTDLEVPFVAVNGKTDRICRRQDVRTYMRQLKKGKLILLAHLGHGFADRDHWEGPFRDAFEELMR